MKKFKYKKTGSILIPNSKLVEEQMAKSPDYEEVKAKKKDKE